MELMLFKIPLALVLYGIGLGLCILDRCSKTTGSWLTLSSVAVTLIATVYAILMGVGLDECAMVLMAFALLHMGVKE